MSGNYYTLITGSSSGIGRSIAFECAKRKMNLVLVALEADLLMETSKSIRDLYLVDIHIIAIDLTKTDATDIIYDFCVKRNLRINFLVNNAGLGDGGLFEYIPLDIYHTILDLNNRAMVSLTYRFLTDLKRNAPAAILNTSSIEATLPLPYKAVYTATKNFIYTFSLALNEELRGSNVHVTVLCPGPVPTNAENLKRYHAHGWRAKLIATLPDEVAAIAIRDTLRRRRVVVPGVINKLIVLVMHFMPLGWKMRILERLFRVYRTHHLSSSK
jgi:short-subunit dehydrogenase